MGNNFKIVTYKQMIKDWNMCTVLLNYTWDTVPVFLYIFLQYLC